MTEITPVPTSDIWYAGQIRKRESMNDLAATYEDYQGWSLPG